MKTFSIISALALTLMACGQESSVTPKNSNEMERTEQNKEYEIKKSEAEWKAELSEQEYYILREKGTERAFTGDLLDNKQEGVYLCRACGQELFTSETKYNSGSGWPSFYKAIDGKVEEDTDTSHGMVRTEILCDRCGSHLGHVFPDGPKPTGMRYCVNSASLDFEEKDLDEEE